MNVLVNMHMSEYAVGINISMNDLHDIHGSIEIVDNFKLSTMPANHLYPLSSWWETNLAAINFGGEFYVSYSNEQDSEIAESVIEAKVSELKCSPWITQGYVEFDPPVKEKDESKTFLKIHFYLSSRGNECLETTKNHMVWNTKTHCVDYTRTEQFYRDYMTEKRLHVDNVKHIMQLPKEHFANLISDTTIFILNCNLTEKYYHLF